MVFEDAGQGNDIVLVALDPRTPTNRDYILGNFRFPNNNAEVETLAMADPASVREYRLTGNLYNQTIIGNAGRNTLNGGGGTDTLVGLGGDDVYLVDIRTPHAARPSRSAGRRR